jgi:hypothetical protein
MPVMDLKLPPWSVFRPDLRLLVCRPRGIVDEALLAKTMTLLEAAEREAEVPFNRYIDLSRIDAVDLRLEFLFKNALRRRAARAEQPSVKAAMYVTSEATRRVAQTHALLTDNSPLRVRVFKEEIAAANWLGVRLEDLAAA